MRIGYGWDSHEFKAGVPLRIGGVAIEHSHGLAGHSDGDVLLHALTDALLGAIAAGDIGTFFPPSDPKWKGADSAVFVEEALKKIRAAGYLVANVDSTLILAAPKIVPYAAKIQEHVAQLLGVRPSDIGVKAKTPEGMGTDNAAIAHVVVLLDKGRSQGLRRKRVATDVPQKVVDEVAKKVIEQAVARQKHTRN
jgi:2-C-methyl-D-erythritol 2,4-cyclodiphosphate synthase